MLEKVILKGQESRLVLEKVTLKGQEARLVLEKVALMCRKVDMC